MGEPAFAIIVFLGSGLAFALLAWRREAARSSIFREQIGVRQNEEEFARAIFQTEPSEENFLRLLENHLSKLFPNSRILVWRFLEQELWANHESFQFSLVEVSAWLLAANGVEHIEIGDPLPWNTQSISEKEFFVASIFQDQGETPIAALALEGLEGKSMAENATELIAIENRIRYCTELLSGYLVNLQRVHNERELQQVQQEISIASQIQSDLLPIEYPDMPGWQLAFSLQSAGDLSGDFLDFIPLDENRIGILIADVAGKGLGAALYMTLCRTLIRTFAKEYLHRPDLVIADCNERLLEDARDALFVTAFYGVLDFDKNILTYANAGHNPPFLIQAQGQDKALPLTGMPIGIDPEESWTYEEIGMQAGDLLVLYTDGLPDAGNSAAETFGNQRLLDQLKSSAGKAANVVLDELLASITEFSADVPQFDDMTTLILKREGVQQ